MLKRFCDFIVDKRKWFILLTVVLAIVFAGLLFLVNINYDMTTYLPKNSEMSGAMDTMFTEFGSGTQASFMIKDIDIKDVSKIRQEIATIQDVEGTLWIDNALSQYYDEKGEDGKSIIGKYEIPVFGTLENLIRKTYKKGELIHSDGTEYTDGEKFSHFVIENKDTLISSGLVPAEMQGMIDMLLGQFYKDGNALIQVFLRENSYCKSTIIAINNVKKVIENTKHNVEINNENVEKTGYEYCLGGIAASGYAMQTTVESEIIKLITFVAPAIIIILLLFTNSYFEPIIYLIVIGISVALNMGSNAIMPSVSYLTFSIAAFVQVAVSMDYSIFIMHSYKANRESGMDKVESAKQALYKSMSSVSASSLTTIAGFLALVFMSYTLGADMGIVLAKGILCSLLTAFIFMPGLLVACDKPLFKCEHTPIFEAIKNLANKVGAKRAYKKANTTKSLEEFTKDYLQIKADKSHNRGVKVSNNLLKLRFIVPILFVAMLAPAYFVQANNEFMYGELNSSGGNGSVLMEDRNAIEELFGSQNAMVVLIKNEYANIELELSNKLANIDNIDMVQSLAVVEEQMQGTGMPIPSFLRNQFVGKNYHMIMLIVNSGEEDATAFKAVDDIKQVVKETIPDKTGYEIVGNSIVAQELKVINNKDYTLSTSLALLFIFIILLFTFKGLVLPIVLAILIQGSIWFAMTIPAFADIPIVFLGYLIVSCFQMGCTIDYGILFSNNYLKYRQDNDKLTACKLAFKSSVGAISLSAIILMTVGYIIGIAGSIPATSMLGLLLGIGATVSYFSMTYILPLFLVLLDKPILKTTLNCKKLSFKKQSSVIESNGEMTVENAKDDSQLGVDENKLDK